LPLQCITHCTLQKKLINATFLPATTNHVQSKSDHKLQKAEERAFLKLFQNVLRGDYFRFGLLSFPSLFLVIKFSLCLLFFHLKKGRI
jgi:hypothetical protein